MSKQNIPYLSNTNRNNNQIRNYFSELQIDYTNNVLFNARGTPINVNEINERFNQNDQGLQGQLNGWYKDEYIQAIVKARAFSNNLNNEGPTFVDLNIYGHLNKQQKTEFMNKVNTNNLQFICPVTFGTLPKFTEKNFQKITEFLADENVQQAKSVRFLIHLEGHWVVLNVTPGNPNKFQLFDGMGNPSNNETLMKNSYAPLLNQLERKYGSKPEIVTGYQKDGKNCGPYACEILTAPDIDRKKEEIRGNPTNFGMKAEQYRASHRNLFNSNSNEYKKVMGASKFADKVFNTQNAQLSNIRIKINISYAVQFVGQKGSVSTLINNCLKFYNPPLQAEFIQGAIIIKNPPSNFNSADVIKYLNNNFREFDN